MLIDLQKVLCVFYMPLFFVAFVVSPVKFLRYCGNEVCLNLNSGEPKVLCNSKKPIDFILH